MAYRDGRLAEARERLRHAVHLAETWGEPSLVVSAYAALAETELATGDRSAARAAVARAGCRGIRAHHAGGERSAGCTVRSLGRGSATAASEAGGLVDRLTDRELSLRMLPGSAM